MTEPSESDVLAAAEIAAAMVCGPDSEHLTGEQIAVDAVRMLKRIKEELLKDESGMGVVSVSVDELERGTLFSE